MNQEVPKRAAPPEPHSNGQSDVKMEVDSGPSSDIRDVHSRAESLHPPNFQQHAPYQVQLPPSHHLPPPPHTTGHRRSHSGSRHPIQQYTPAEDLQRRIAELERERDHYKAIADQYRTSNNEMIMWERKRQDMEQWLRDGMMILGPGIQSPLHPQVHGNRTVPLSSAMVPPTSSGRERERKSVSEYQVSLLC